MVILCFSLTFPETPLISLEGETQGTTYHIKYQDNRQRNVKQSIDSLLTEIDKCLSIYRADSELSQFNRGMNHRFQRPYFYPVLKKSDEVFRATDGAFDPTVLPLVDAYGFGPKKPVATDVVNVDSLLQFVGLQNITFDSTTVQKKKKNVQLDFNGIAQGYSVDVLAKFLEAKGITNYMVEIGGEIRTKGQKGNGQFWTVGITNPLHPDQLYVTLKLVDQAMPGRATPGRAMTTAGNYRNHYVSDGQVFSHIINSKTGMMEQSELLSVTVLAADAITADAYDTAFMVMGLEKTKRFLKNRPDLDAFLMYTDTNGQLQTYATEGLKHLQPTGSRR
ncbi:FAD:protein FMN transferase [Spirosoma terrae]|uniref:FAD:protein FMN transferase n=1 Tax=Spirosoma terrae TaxID=1968276 RepID=UPI00293B9858|nr:FAD:protein FMN transferase [Spirosoma terrae]